MDTDSKFKNFLIENLTLEVYEKLFMVHKSCALRFNSTVLMTMLVTGKKMVDNILIEQFFKELSIEEASTLVILIFMVNQ